MDGMEIQTKLTMMFTILLASIKSQSDILSIPTSIFEALSEGCTVRSGRPEAVRKQSGSKSGSPEAVRK